MRFFFSKKNRRDFERQLEKVWAALPERGPCVCELAGYRPDMKDGIRKYYFDFVLGPYCEDQGMGKVDAHETFKERLSELYGNEDGTEYHVFGNESNLTQQQKEDFVRDVRSILVHECGITTEAWRCVD